ncbi:hypothetical protein OK074_2416 [Actinobacteria bacterium OK074]|nr:hypothetical protein OK074_2416 [Actinobacteria bacterium OK074]
MNLDELVRDSLREQAQDAPSVPPGLADRVLALRRRRRNRTIAVVAVATAAVVAVAVGVPMLNSGGQDVRPASRMNRSDIIGHPDQSPPESLIAAGDTALGAFYVTKNVKQPNGDTILTRTYGLLNQKTGTYRKTDKWGFVAVAPGLRTAAVLGRQLPTGRIGLLDLTTGKITRWIEVGHGPGGLAGLAFSPDGKKLVATTYAKNPDRSFADHPVNLNGKEVPGPVLSRNGYAVVDIATGDYSWLKVPISKEERDFGFGNSREDFAFSADGSLVYVNTMTKPYREFYGLEDGVKVPVPASEKYRLPSVEAGLSPNGKLVAGDFAGSGDEIAAAVNDAKTGKRVAKVPAQQLLAWADDKRLIGWGCDPKKCSGTGEFHNQLILVTIGTGRVVPLSGFRKASDDYPGRWVPLFSSR